MPRVGRPVEEQVQRVPHQRDVSILPGQLHLLFLLCFDTFSQIYYIERQHSEGEKGNVFLGETFVKLSRPTPTAFYGDKSRLCISLGFKEDDFYFFCSLVDQCFKQNSPKPSLATKLLLGFVKARFEKEKKKSVQKGQFDACLEMMKEANLVKQVGNSILHLSSFKRASD